MASDACPAMTALVTTVLRWPDRHQAKGYVVGFPVVDQLQYSGVFRDVPQKADHIPSDALLGDYSREVIDDILHTRFRGYFFLQKFIIGFCFDITF